MAVLSLFFAVTMIADRGIPEEVLEADPERMIVALGAPAQRLEPPPPPQPDLPPPEPDIEPQVPTERAEEAPPPAPPEVQRQPILSASTDGRASSGLGEMREPSPPPPPPPPVELTQRFIDISARQYIQHVEYPYDALRRQLQGRGKLRVVVTRDGKVLSWSLMESTGHRVLDKEIERVARKVDSVDPLPREYDRARAVLIIPFTFVMST